METKLLGLVSIVTLLAGYVETGTWEMLNIESGVKFELGHVGWSPYERRSMIFGAMACTEVALNVYTKSGDTYFIIYIGFYDNTYALIIPSADCDDTGNCNIVNFSPGTYLDCGDYRFFWVSWDLSGNVALGTDYTVGVNTLIAITNGLTEEAVYANFEITDVYGGSVYLSVENEPVFLSPAPDGSTEITMTETSTTGTALYTIATSDPDGDTVTGYILDDSTTFVFSGNDLTNLVALDYETECSYHVKITIHDGANMVNTTLTINLLNAFDEPPSVDAMSVSLPEELPIGSYIDSGLTVSDSDDGDQLTYSLSGTHASYFEVTSDGRLKVAARIDFDPPNSITQLDQLTLTVTDLGSNTNSTTLTFAVKDVNDMKPLFSQPVYNAAVTEGAGTVSLLQLTITDDDSGVNADFDVTMDGDDPSDPAFTFDPSTLQLSVDANKLDYESMAATDFTSTLTFVATDKATESEPRTGTAVAVIKVNPENEHTPVWTTQPADTSVSETAPGGSLVDTYTATDDDITEHGDVTYSIVSITSASGSDGSGKFSLDSKSGELRVTSPLDADTSTGGDSSYVVVIQASDCCSKNVQASVTITVTAENDNAPAFTQQIYYGELMEAVASGDVVVEATDADGDALTFTLSGKGSDMFSYSSPKVYLNNPLDFETQRYYFLTLRASDGVHETDVAVNINVTDILDEPTVITVHNPLSLVEELPVGSPLGGVYDATDKDKDEVLTYSLEGTESSYFSIDLNSGLITIAQRMDRDAGLTSITDVTLKVTDVASVAVSQPLTFDVVDINDNSPQFTSDVIFVDVRENTGIDTLLKTFSVTDDDDGDNSNVVVSIVSGDDANPNEKFRLNGLELLTTSTAVDYEALSSANFLYTLTVQAVDQPTTEAAKTAVAVVVVKVLPVNEHPPAWVTDPADTTLSETSSPGTVIATYTATDDDLGKDGNVTYELSSILDNQGADGSGTFTLDSGNGEFALAANLDADTSVTYYDVTVKAVDAGTPVQSVEKTIRISVGAENDNPPVFSKSAYDGEIAEDVATGTSVLGFVVTDVDGDTATVTVIGGDGTFTIDGSDVKTAATLDYETRRCYNFRLRASDGVHETEVAVNINITNVIDENPLLNVNTPVSLLEELLINTPLGGVYDVTDIDDDDTLTYSLEGTGSSYFSVDPSTGVISVAQRMDRETGLTSITDVTLKVTDAGGNVASEALTFDIVDINDNSPTFAVDVFFVNVTENTPNGQVFFTISCTDVDDGDNAAVSVKIKSGDVSPARFSLTGMDLVSTGQPVDYEDPSVPSNMYTLSIQAEDAPHQGDPHVAIATVVVMVLPENEFTPVFTAPTAADVTISETSQTSSVVETFSATDDDGGEDGQVVYEITSVTDPSGGDASTKFLIEEVTGVLRVAESLDVDVTTGGVAYYDVTVTATDKGLTPKSASQTLRINLQNENDLTPEFLDFTYFVNVPEDTNVNDVILTFTVQDGDGDTVTASLVDGETSLFSVAGTDVTLAQKLDYETLSSHSIAISISDGVHTANQTLVVRVTDVIDETPNVVTFTPVFVTEELPVGTAVDGLYHMTDLDRGDSWTFTLQGTDSSFFAINATSGSVKLAQRIDLETLAGDSVLDQLTLTVTDQAGLQATASLSVEILDINDAYPTFAESVYKVNISESSTTEILVDLVATDADSGTNGAITMQITDGDDPGASKFQLSGTQLSALGADLDYEALEDTQYMYILTVSATDSPTGETPKTGVTLVVVSILPVNEHTPVWSAALSVSGGALPDLNMMENVTVGSGLLTLQATDDDHGVDGDVTYTITSAVTNTGASAVDLFALNPVTGTLRTAGNLDRDITTGQMYYDLTLTARDGGNPYKETSATLKIILDNVNDNAPVFTSADYRVDVAETTPVGTAIHTFAAATDVDGDAITYSIVGGHSDVFGTTGVTVETLIQLDYEQERCYSLVIQASDGTHDVNVTMTINVTDVIDEQPAITVNNPLTIPEELTIGSKLSWAYDVIDKDKDDSLTYTLTGSDAGYFSLDSTTGQLTVAQRLDREVKAVLDTLTLRVEDSAGLADEASLAFTIKDINDNAPKFVQDVHVVHVAEGGTVEVDLVTFVVVDFDDGDNGAFDVSITSGNDGGEFRLDGLVLKGDSSMIDYETPAVNNYTYILSVQAVDKPTDGGSRTGSTVVVVHIGPANEFKPTWVSPVPTADVFPDLTIPETPAPTTRLITYDVSDDDDGVHGVVTFSIPSASTAEGTDASSLFLIDPVVGSLWMTAAPDADTQTGGTSRYDVFIVAADGGNEIIEAKQTVHVANTNDNPPTIWASSYAKDVIESTPVGDVVFTLEVKDIDLDTVTSSVTEGADLFSFDGTSVTTTGILDFESVRCHTVVISASDGVHDVNVTLTVNVTDDNDQTPEVTLHGAVSIPEEQPVGTIIGGLFDAIDKDEVDSLAYTLSGTDDQYIEIDPSTGELKVKARIDRDIGVTFLDDLTLTVTDLAGHSESVNLNVSVLDINDNAPECTQTVFKVNFTEGEPDGLVATLSCYDNDSGDNGNFVLSITDGDDLNYFSLVGLEVHASSSTIDYESVDNSVPYIVTVGAIDQPSTEAAKTGAVTIIAQILPVNEFKPTWVSPAPTGDQFPDVAIPEAAVTTSIVTYNATDDDKGDHGKITYSVASATTAEGDDASSLFLIDPVVGSLWMTAAPDADTQTGGTSRYDVFIVAADGGNKIIEAKQTIHVTNTNDNPPTIWASSYAKDVIESTPVGDVVFTLEVKDIDLDTVTSSVTEGADLFSFDGTSVTTTGILDFESVRCHTVVISASDGVHDVNVTLTINVTDVNDNSPEVTLHSSVSIPEELPVGTVVGGVYEVTDKDDGDTLSYVVSGSHSHYVEIDSSTGELKVKARIDRDGSSGVTVLDDLTLTVTDLAGHSSSANLNISVLDVNDNAPECSQTLFKINITEGEPDGLVATLSCYDNDSGDNGNFVLSITDGDDLNYFSLVGLDVHASSSTIDYESIDTSVPYIVTVGAVDQPTTEAAKTGAVTLIAQIQPQNEHSPVWTTPQVFVSGGFPDLSLPEDTPSGSDVVKVTAVDDDAGEDGDVVYEILSVTDENGVDRSSLFFLDKSTGLLKTSGVLDRDLATGGVEYFDTAIKASDRGTTPNSIETNLKLTLTGVNDNAPVFKNVEAEVMVTETTSAGTDIYKLEAEDYDGDSVDFQITGGSASLFQVVGSDLRLLQELDYETQHCHTVVFSATDGTYTANVSLTINVGNVVDEEPVITLIPPLVLLEELPVGMSVGGFLSVEDPDERDNLTYSISGTGSDYFTIDSSTGTFSIAKRIDRDVPGNMTFVGDLTLTVTDSAGLQDSVALNFSVVDLNDNTPVCGVTTGQVTVTENSASGVVLSEITCNDADSGDFSTVAMSIDSSSDPDGYFQLSGTELISGVNAVDYEARESTDYMLNIKVLAIDNPSGDIQLTATSIVTIKVLPENEHTPAFTAPVLDGSGSFPDVTVSEDITMGTVVTSFNATDGDHGDDGRIVYAVTSVITDSGDQVPGTFTVDASSGELRVSGQLDADAATGGVSYYVVNITATDAGSSPRSTHGALRVDVTGSNDNPPEWNMTVHEMDVYENASVGQDVVSLVADDADGDTVTFSSSDAKFKVDGSILKVDQQLDFEQRRCHAVVISATDGTYTVNQTVVVNVLDSNDETPVVTVTKAIYIPEGIPVGTDVARGHIVTDADEDDTLSYSLQGVDGRLLAINSSTGEITLKEALDYESLASDNLDVVLHVEDVAGHTVTQALDIVVTDVNDNTPVFSKAVHSASVAENSTGETVLLTLTATDADSGTNGQFTFNISDGNNDGLFRLDGDELYVQVVDYESASSVDFMYSLTVTAVDHAADARTGVTVVIIEVTPENEFVPAWSNPSLDSAGYFPSVTLAEDVGPDHDAVTVTATDADLGEDGEVTYSITSVVSDTGVNKPGVFIIESGTGKLKTSSTLDFDQSTGGVKYYDVTITVSDKGTVPKTTSAIQRVNLTNVNDIGPEFLNDTYTVNVACNDVVGSSLVTLSAGDEDGPSLLYEIEAGTNPYVSVDGVSGEVTLTVSPTGVAVTDLVQSIPLLVSDQGTPNLQGKGHLLVVFENCQSSAVCSNDTNVYTPTFSKSLHTVAVPENATGETLLLNLTATDNDNGTNGQFTFNISDGNTDGLFRLDGDNLYAQVVDYESASSVDFMYSLTITAVDHAADARTGVTVVIVEVTPENEFAPVCSSPSVDGVGYFPSVTLAEDVGPDHDVVIVTATDADLGEDGEVTYSITSVVSDTGVNMPGLFVMEFGTGKMKTSSTLDFDQSTGGVKYYDVTITVSDKGTVPKTTSAIQRVNLTNVNDIAPEFQSETYNVNVACNDVVGSSLVTLSADDEDGPSLFYEIEAGTIPYVSVDGVSGEVTLTVSPTGVAVTDLVQSIPLLVSDQGTPNLQGKAHLLVVFENCQSSVVCSNDTNVYTPTFSKSLHTVAVPENATGETLLLNLTATDNDNGTNGQFTFNISDGNTDGLFRLDGDNLYAQVVDYESASSVDFMYSLTITAVDHAADARTGVTVVIVEVTPENEFAPVCSSPSVDGVGYFPSVTLAEDVGPDHDVVIVTATDADLGEDGEVTYSITSVVSDTGVNMPGLFVMEFGTGKMKTSSTLDFDQSTGGVKYYDVTITVSDKGTVPKTTSAIQRVNLTNVNDIAPEFQTDTYTVNLACNDVVGSSLVTLSADDEDGPSLLYEIEAGTNPYVSVDGVSGEVTLMVSPSGVAVTDLVQSIPLLVSDQGTPNLQGKGHLLVVFENCQSSAVCSNDTNVYTPTFSKSLHTVAVPENGTGESIILTFTATDADNGTNGQFSFNIIDGNNDGLFRLDGDDLYVQVVDYEGSASVNFTYTLIVTAVDHAADAKTGVTVVVVEISPQNEFDPVYQSPKPDSSGEFPVLTIVENEPIGYEVVVVTATDADLGVDGHVVYSIGSVLTDAGVSEPNKFSIDPSTGRLTTSSQLDSDPSTGGTAYYNVTIVASDMGSSPRSAAVLQTVIVQNVNDIQPALSVTMTTVKVPCGTTAGTSLATLTAVDEDGPSLSFAIDSGSNPYVSVSNSGEVTLLSSPVGSAVDDLVENIQVLVSDGGTPELTITGHVQILFENCGNSTVCPSVTTATTTKAPTCDCSNVTTTEDTPPSRSASDVIETWVMRAAVMMLTAALFGVLAMYLRPKAPSITQKGSGKVFPRETTLERGIQDDSGKPFDDDLEHHFLHK